MVFIYPRTIRFHETDAAGVVYFANVLTLCHEAYEASLAAAGIDLRVFFYDPDRAVPVVHASVDFRKPLVCGDNIAIYLVPQQTGDSTFEMTYHIHPDNSDVLIAKALTRHVCIQTHSRQRTPLTSALIRWLSQWSDPLAAQPLWPQPADD